MSDFQKRRGGDEQSPTCIQTVLIPVICSSSDLAAHGVQPSRRSLSKHTATSQVLILAWYVIIALDMTCIFSPSNRAAHSTRSYYPWPLQAHELHRWFVFWIVFPEEDEQTRSILSLVVTSIFSSSNPTAHGVQSNGRSPSKHAAALQVAFPHRKLSRSQERRGEQAR
jgi:hypothetical protein